MAAASASAASSASDQKSLGGFIANDFIQGVDQNPSMEVTNEADPNYDPANRAAAIFKEAAPAALTYPCFKLSKLPYDVDALEKLAGLSPLQVSIHYGRHHQTYVDNLNGKRWLGDPAQNAARAKMSLRSLMLRQIANKEDQWIFNQAAQIWNHSFYWRSMCASNRPAGASAPGVLDPARHQAMHRLVSSAFPATDKSSLEILKTTFNEESKAHFGSGWTWLVYDPATKGLRIVSTHDAGNPLRDSLIPLLTCDIWEHAYYIDFKQARASYAAKWWNAVDFDFAEQRLVAAQKV